MKIYIKCTDKPSNLAFHCTHKESDANSIVANGFDTTLTECCLTNSLYNAQGYGGYCIACNLDDVTKLKLYPKLCRDDVDIHDPTSYPADCQGIYEPVNLEKKNSSLKIFYIFDIEALNQVVTWIRYPEGDRRS